MGRVWGVGWCVEKTGETGWKSKGFISGTGWLWMHSYWIRRPSLAARKSMVQGWNRMNAYFMKYFLHETDANRQLDRWSFLRPNVEEWQQKAADANRQVRIPQRFSRCCWYHGYHYNISWVVPPPSNSHHQDYYIFSRESQPKPSFATVTGWRVDPINTNLLTQLEGNIRNFSGSLVIKLSKQTNITHFNPRNQHD